MQTAKVATSQASTSDSPVRKRVKSVDDSVAAPPPIQAKAKKAAAPERKQTTPRHSKAPAKKPAAAPAHDTKAKASQKDDVEVGCQALQLTLRQPRLARSRPPSRTPQQP
jgi:hypothetical protein